MQGFWISRLPDSPLHRNPESWEVSGFLVSPLPCVCEKVRNLESWKVSRFLGFWVNPPHTCAKSRKPRMFLGFYISESGLPLPPHTCKSQKVSGFPGYHPPLCAKISETLKLRKFLDFWVWVTPKWQKIRNPKSQKVSWFPDLQISGSTMPLCTQLETQQVSRSQIIHLRWLCMQAMYAGSG